MSLGDADRWPMLSFANRRRWRYGGGASSTVPANTFIYVPTSWFYRWTDRAHWSRRDDVRPPWIHPLGTGTYKRFEPGSSWRIWFHQAQKAVGLGDPNAAFSFSRQDLFRKIDEKTGYRPRWPTWSDGKIFRSRIGNFNTFAQWRAGADAQEEQPDLWVVAGASPWFCFGHPCTIGQYIFLNGEQRTTELLAHEYIHVLEWEGRGEDFGRDYFYSLFATQGASPSHPDEAVAYLYQGLYHFFSPYYEKAPWRIWHRPAQ